MIFTVGREDIYEDYIDNNKNAAKAKGGSVWETFKDAQNYCNETNDAITYDMPKYKYNFRVYGVDADWENDTEIVEGESWRSLKRDEKLIKIVLLSTVFPWVKSES